MWVDLHPLTNTTPYTVVETMSVAKAVVLFRSVALRHMLIMPKYQGPEVSHLINLSQHMLSFHPNVLATNYDSESNLQEHFDSILME
jgi:hypothetical protein